MDPSDRFKYTTTDSPSLGASSAFFTLNPVEIGWEDSFIREPISIMDGEPIIQRPLHDDRIRRMIWRNWPAENTKITSVISEINALKGKVFWIIDDPVGYFSTWTKCRGLNITKNYRAGGGKVRYTDITFEFLVIDSNWTTY